MATPSPTFSSTSNSDAGNVSTGAAVGIGIGSAVAGAFIAGLIVWFLLRRKRQRPDHVQEHLPSNRGAHGHQEKRGTTAVVTSITSGGVTNIDRLLPQPAEDDAIIGTLSKIQFGIKNHVQNYYHNAPVRHDEVDEARLQELATATSIPTPALRDLLLNPATRVSAIRLYLAHLILSRCTGRTDGLSFLPNEISGLAFIANGDEGTTASQAALFSKWKIISGALLQQQYGEAPDEHDRRASSITQALAAAEPILHPFISPNADQNARRRNLESIVKRAAHFAFVLFSQPSLFRFNYSGQDAHSLVVFPALQESQRVLSAQETVPVG